MTPPKKRSPGRPEGSPNVKADQSEVVLSRCAKCGSTEREPYFGTPFEVPFAGEKDGKPYTHVVKKRTKCSVCGQHRRDMIYENRKR